jgi:hypothetical protein
MPPRTSQPIYRELASIFSAYTTCLASNNAEWESKHREAIEYLCEEFLPSGSGIDCGTKFDFDHSKPDKLVLTFSYYHMNDCGMYNGWTEHTLTIRPSLLYEFVTTISGRDRNQIKDYLYDTYHQALRERVCQDEEGNWFAESRHQHHKEPIL